MMTKKIQSAMLILLFVCGVSFMAMDVSYAADNVIRWRCQAYQPASSALWEGSTLRFVKTIKEQTGGRLVIEPFVQGAIVPVGDIYAAVGKGMIEMGSVYPGVLRGKVPLAAIAGGLPFMFKKPWECAYFHEALGFEKMMRDECAKDGVYFSTDCIAQVDLLTKKPIRSIKDLKGMKLRSSGEFQIWFNDLGVAASYLPGGEIYAALASGVVEGVHWGSAKGASEMGFYEICKFNMVPSIAVAGYNAWLINQKAIDSLPKDIRDILYMALEQQFWSRTNQYTYDAEIELTKLEKQGVELVHMPVEDQKVMYLSAMKIWDKVATQSPECAKAIEIAKRFLISLGYIE